MGRERIEVKSPEQIVRSIIMNCEGRYTSEQAEALMVEAIQSERAEAERLRAENRICNKWCNDWSAKAANLGREVERQVDEIAELNGQFDALVVKKAKLQAELDEAALQVQRLLASAVPHPEQHPTMYAAWQSADEWLSRHAERQAVDKTELEG